jgi:hypothetical protein
MRDALRYAFLCLFKPSAAARESGSVPELALGSFFYLVTILLKPWSMPPGSGSAAVLATTPWTELAFWDTALTAIGFLWLASFLAYLKEGRGWSYSLRLMGAMAASAAAAGLLAGGWRHAPIAACLLGLLAASFAVKFPRSQWLGLVSFMLGINVIALALFPIEWASGLWLEKAWMPTTIVVGMWMLVAAGLGLREITGIRLARILLALIFLNIWQAVGILALHRLCLISKTAMAALFYG